jgi:hypothetical protein
MLPGLPIWLTPVASQLKHVPDESGKKFIRTESRQWELRFVM